MRRMRAIPKRHARACLAIALAALGAATAFAGSFGVAPTRVDLGRGARSSLIEVSSDDTRKLSFQARLSRWQQDAAGKDEYAESQDLIFFPPLFSVNPGDKRVIRVGLKAGEPIATETAYRLFIEEIPEPSPATSGSEVKVVLRFGVPIFIAPAGAKPEFVVEAVEPVAGKVSMRVRNAGNVSAKFETVKILREGAVLAEATGWYVFPGVTRTFEVPLGAARCAAGDALEAVAQAEGVVLRRSFAAPAALCARP